ncbi:MAG: hypothetical protein ACETWR_17370, partial [Anaerolineae bacterium]
LLGILIYRQFYLGQPWTEYWDIALTFFIGTSYVTLASFARGAVYETSMIRCVKWTVPSIVITIVVVAYLKGGINTIVELLTGVISALLGLSIVGLVAYYLYRRWEKKNDLAD